MAKSKSSSLHSDQQSLIAEAERGHYVLYPSGGTWNKLRATPEARFLNELLVKNMQDYYNARNRRLFIINNILRLIPGGLRAWDKQKNQSFLLDEEEAYRRVAQKIRDMKKSRPDITVPQNAPPAPAPAPAAAVPTRRLPKRKATKVPEAAPAEPEPAPKKSKVLRKLAPKPAPRSEAPVHRPTITDARRQSPMRDITPDQVKDELISSLRTEITRLRTLVRNQDMELHALRTLQGSGGM